MIPSPQFLCIVGTLTASNTNYNLWTDIIKPVVDPTGAKNIVPLARELQLQPTSSNTASVMVGDSAMDGTTRWGLELSVGGSPGVFVISHGNLSSVPITNIFVRSTGTGQKINIVLVNE